MPRRKASTKTNRTLGKSSRNSTKTGVPAVSSMGRPRSVESEQAILAAAWTWLQQSSVRQVSIEAIAREASVVANFQLFDAINFLQH